MSGRTPTFAMLGYKVAATGNKKLPKDMGPHWQWTVRTSRHARTFVDVDEMLFH